MHKDTRAPVNPFTTPHRLAAAIAACLRQRSRLQLASAAGLALALAAPALVQAATFTVTNTNDSGPGSLRQAVLEANALAGGDEILFESSGGMLESGVSAGADRG